jgi:hypothetical protein
MICPNCKGKKQFTAILCGEGGCRSGVMQCHTCNGLGEVTEEHYKKILIGEFKRKDRISRGLSLREEAERLGITPYELSKLEHPKMEASNG